MAVLKSDISLFMIGAFQSAEEVVNKLSQCAMTKGFVDETFAVNVMRREREYPTGLQMGVPIAIPHIHEGCLESFFAMALPDDPVSFFNMGDSSEELFVEIVFLFGITDPSEQAAVLKKFARTFQRAEVLEELRDSTSTEELARKIKNVLGDMVSIGKSADRREIIE